MINFVTNIRLASTLTPVWMSLAVAVSQPAPVAAQATLVVTTAEASSRDFVPGVEIRILELKRSAKTDIFGEVRMSGVKTGTYRIEARLLGYKPEAVDLPFRSADTVRVTFLLTRIATSLDTTHVTAGSIPTHLSEFEARRSFGVGRFLTEPDLAAAANSDLARFIAQRVPGLNAVSGPAGRGTFLFSTRGVSANGKGRGNNRCPIQVYVDGTRYGAPQEPTDLSDLKAQDLAGVEFYSEASTPAQYRSGNVCGVLLIWTK